MRKIKDTQFANQVPKEDLIKFVSDIGYKRPKPCTIGALAKIIVGHVDDNCEGECLAFMV